MSNQITHATNKVTYRWTFNQNLTGRTGTFWDGSPYVINATGLKLTNVEMISEHGTETANRVISDIELGYFKKPGFKGELYINGLMKNPKGMHDYSSTGVKRDKNTAFDSRSFGTFDEGWIRFTNVRDPVTKKNVKVPIPTNLDSSYPNFNLTKFLETKTELESGGINVTTGDVLVVQWSNFNRDASFAWDIKRATGFPYQRIRSRSCALSYGTLFVLNAAPASTSFRPPVLWPEGQEASRPIYPVSKITNRPTQEELIPNPAPTQKVSNFTNDPSFKTFCYGMPFGGGTNYSQALPLYPASVKGDISAYGAYYQKPLVSRLATLYSVDVSDAQRLENLKVVVQWGIDAFGSIKSFASTSSGAGQKPCSARPWSIIAGYFLGVTALQAPESEMLKDNVRTTAYLNESGAGAELEDEDGESEGELTVSEKTRNMIDLYGDPFTQGAEGLTAKKRWLALQTALESQCYYKVKDQVGSILDYRTLGRTHRRTFSGAGANLQQTNENTEFGLINTFKSSLSFRGNFAKIQWNTVPPDLNKEWAASHDGKAPTFWYSYIKVISGPGAGDTLYRIIKSWGDFRNSKADNQPNATGYGFILDRPWQHGQPDTTTTFEMISFIERNVGEIFYLIGPTRFKGMADANLSPTTTYAPIAENLVTPLYGWMKYIERTKGTNPDLDKGSVLTHEYVDRIIGDSPYEWVSYSTDRHYLGYVPWEAAVFNKFYNRPNDRAGQAALINWDTIPGIKYWHGITVDDYRNIPLPGDFNNNDIVDKADVKMLVDEWNKELTGATYDLNRDGIVGVDDLKILLNDYYGTTQ